MFYKTFCLQKTEDRLSKANPTKQKCSTKTFDIFNFCFVMEARTPEMVRNGRLVYSDLILFV